MEILGHYDPRAVPAVVRVNRERIEHWIKAGALPSDTIRTLMARHLTPEPAPAPTATQGATGTTPAAPAGEAPRQ